MGKLINKILGLRPMISTSLANKQAFLKLCLVNLISKDTHIENSVRMNDDPDIGRLVMGVFSWNHYAATGGCLLVKIIFFVSAQWANLY